MEERKSFSELYQGDFLKARLAYYATIDEMIKYERTEAQNWVGKAHQKSHFNISLIVILNILGFLFASFLGFFISKSLSAKLSTAAAQVAGGAEIVTQVSGQILAASEELSSGVHSQSQAIQQTTASIHQITAMTDKSSENAQMSSKISMESEGLTREGQEVAQRMLKAMLEIKQSNDEIIEVTAENNISFKNVIGVIESIAEKTKVINDIVFQTKLLSFNASVEAARAGENGKGFSVVAEEVGNLAQMSGQAAQEISALVTSGVSQVHSLLQKSENRIQKITQESSSRVEHGKAVAEECGQVFSQVVLNVAKVNSCVSEISAASSENAQGIREITNAMGLIDQTTLQNTTAAQKTSESSVQLTQQAQDLRSTVLTLNRIIEGGQQKRAAS